jgi:Zn finger protein HypA/HybF involved in hydrogenase expression
MSNAKKKNLKKKSQVVEDDISIASELFEETIELAEEEDAVCDVKTFATFIVDMIPTEILDELKILAGIMNDEITEEEIGRSTSSSSSSRVVSALDPSTFRFLEDIWCERYEVKVVEDDKAEWDRETNSFECELCERLIQTTRHHVYPKETHEWLRKRNESHYSVMELRKTIALCRMCHSAIHRFYSNRDLAIDYCSLELLLESDQVCKFAKWASSMQGRGNLRTR